MLNPVIIDSFVDELGSIKVALAHSAELRKTAYNEAFLARKIMGTAKSLGRAKAAPKAAKAAKPPPIPPQAIGTAKSRRMTSGSQAAGAKKDKDLSTIENMILAKGAH